MRAVSFAALKGAACVLISMASLTAQESFILVRDINPSGDSDPELITDVAGMTFFSAFEPGTGRELWRTDGTAAGTALVLDIAPGPASASPDYLIDFGGRLLFLADDGSHGGELWISDGTAAGTVMIADLAPGGSFPRGFTELGGQMFFTAVLNQVTLAFNSELMRTDGTAAGTAQVVDINGDPGTGSSVDGLLVFEQRLVFQADDGIAGREVWTSDGTAAGTFLLADTKPGPQWPSNISFAIVDAGLLFVTDNQWWRSDGTVSGTHPYPAAPRWSAMAAGKTARVRLCAPPIRCSARR